MASWSPGVWEPSLDTGLSRAERKHGSYQRYLPDLLKERPLLVPDALARQATAAERSVRALSASPRAQTLEAVSRFLLRSEAIASSLIEGIAPSPQQVALAELARAEPVRGFGEQAKLVANNITVLRRAARELATVEVVTVEDVEGLHRALLPDEGHQGLRTVQNWIGGSNSNPLGADFVPPPPELVRPLMADLIGYLNGSVHAPLVQAAIVHAQFETIHPFTDGNGRVGRALIHTILTRRGLTPSALLPVSLVLATLRDRYVQGLNAYRYDVPMDDPRAHSGVAAWLAVFIEAAEVAAEQVGKFSEDITELMEDWREKVAGSRLDSGIRQTPRSDSAIARLLAILPEVPILTARTVQRVLNVSFPSARAALEELAEAGVLTRRTIERNTTGYSARDVFDLLGHTERKLASTKWDTRLTPPNRAVPASPDRNRNLPPRES